MKTKTIHSKIKNSVETCRKKCPSQLNQKFFAEKFIYDELNSPLKSMGTVAFRIM